MPEAASVRVPRTFAQETLGLLRRLGLLNAGLRVQSEHGYIHIPLSREPLASELKRLRSDLPNGEFSRHEFHQHQERATRLADLLSGKLPPYAAANLPRAIDFVGDIAVVEIPPELEPFKLAIGAAILEAHKRVRTVLSKSSPVEGVYRVRTYETIGGENKTQTVHREHGCVYHVDLAKAYFSSRLSYEHLRVASLAKDNETVVDMFAGIGPFSILTAKLHPNVRVYAIDMNPDAYELLWKNVLANRMVSKIIPVLGDSRQVVNERLTGVADRVIMNLPERASEYVDVASKALKPEGGVMHYYQFVNMPEPLDTARRWFAEALSRTDRQLVGISEARSVRGIAPFKHQVVVDAEIK